MNEFRRCVARLLILCLLVAGFPLPDIGGTMAAYQYFATDVPPGEEGRSETGGMIERLRFTGNRAEAALLGPADPLAHEDGTRELRVPFVLVWNYEARSVTIEIAGKTVNKGRRLEGRTPSRHSQGVGNPNKALQDLTKDELYNRAKEKGVGGRSKMSKSELIDALHNSR